MIGTRQSSKNSSLVSWPLKPSLSSLRPRLKPGASLSTMIRLIPRCAGLALVAGVASAPPRNMRALLCFATEARDVRDADVRVQPHHEPVRPDPRDLFDHDRVV